MAITVQASNKLLSLNSSSSCFYRRGITKSIINTPKIRTMSPVSFPKLSTTTSIATTTANTTQIEKDHDSCFGINTKNNIRQITDVSYPMVIAKLYAIMEVVSTTIEMHKNIGEQRDNWNNLLLTSINAFTLTAATMCVLAATSAPHTAFKISSTILYLTATTMLSIMNKIQPSQLVEEQRNASRLFKQLHGQILTMLTIGNPTISNVNESMENVLSLDRAYPLPLLGVMLAKFPSTIKPAIWWPQQNNQKQAIGIIGRSIMDGNGWNSKLEEEMREIARVLRRKYKEDYLRLGEIALKINKIMAISGPLLTSLAALGSAFVDTANPWAIILGFSGGVLACIVNAIEHGGQVEMVFEMYRSNAGFFKLIEETIESNINERDAWRR